jgi:hypothetical protein
VLQCRQHLVTKTKTHVQEQALKKSQNSPIFGDEFIFYTSSMYVIFLHCHRLVFPYFILILGNVV